MCTYIYNRLHELKMKDRYRDYRMATLHRCQMNGQSEHSDVIRWYFDTPVKVGYMKVAKGKLDK